MINVVLLFVMSNPAAIWDVLILTGLGLGVQLLQSRVCAVVLAVYGSVNRIVTALLRGSPGGYMILICGVYACIYTFKFQRAWKNYLTVGAMPPVKSR